MYVYVCIFIQICECFLQLDLPLSVTFYRWLLNEETSLTLSDLAHVVPDVHRTLLRFQGIIREKITIEGDMSLTSDQKRDRVSLNCL